MRKAFRIGSVFAVEFHTRGTVYSRRSQRSSRGGARTHVVPVVVRGWARDDRRSRWCSRNVGGLVVWCTPAAGCAVAAFRVAAALAADAADSAAAEASPSGGRARADVRACARSGVRLRARAPFSPADGACGAVRGTAAESPATI